MNNQREVDFTRMEDFVSNQFMDMLVDNMLEAFSLTDYELTIMDPILTLWGVTRNQAREAIKSKMDQMTRYDNESFRDLSDMERF